MGYGGLFLYIYIYIYLCSVVAKWLPTMGGANFFVWMHLTIQFHDCGGNVVGTSFFVHITPAWRWSWHALCLFFSALHGWAG